MTTENIEGTKEGEFAACGCSANGALDWIRRQLKAGAIIRATDTEKPVLELLPDGSCNGGMTIEYSQNDGTSPQNRAEKTL